MMLFFAEAWIQLAPLLANEGDLPPSARREISKDIADAFIQSNDEGRASLGMLLHHIYRQLDAEDPQGAELWNQLVLDAIDILRA